MNHSQTIIKVIAVAVWLFLVFLTAKFVDNWRVAKNYNDLLPPSARQVLAEQAALHIDVFALTDSPAAKLVGNFLQPLLNELNEVEVNYINSSQNSDLVAQFNIQKQGEMVVHSGEQNFQLSTLSYEAFFNGLKRLNHSNNLTSVNWVVFLENLSSHSFSDQAGVLQGNSYSAWLKQLLAANYQAIVLPWIDGMQLPKQAKLIVLAAPAEPLTEVQVQWLEQQIAFGRSIMWLTDPKFANQQPALSLLFDVMRTDGFHQQQLVIKDLAQHEINQHFDRPLDLFEVMPFETSNQALWLNEQKQVLAATFEIDDLSDASVSSRLMVVGDSDFLSNQYLSSGGNLEMSYRLVDWLLHHHNRIDLPSIGVADTQLHFSTREILWFAGTMLILMPLLLLIAAGYFWRKTK